MLLAGCATSVETPAPAPIAPPTIPNVPPDVLACASAPVVTPDRNIDAGETEKLWKTDRAKLAKVNACLRRLICQYQDVRHDIGKVDTVACDPAPKPKRKPWLSFFRKDTTK